MTCISYITTDKTRNMVAFYGSLGSFRVFKHRCLDSSLIPFILLLEEHV